MIDRKQTPIQKFIECRINVDKVKAYKIYEDLGISQPTLMLLRKTGTCHSLDIVRRMVESSGIPADVLLGTNSAVVCPKCGRDFELVNAMPGNTSIMGGE